MAGFTPTGGSGGLPIQVTAGAAGTTRSIFADVLAVASGATQVLLQYISPGVGYLVRIDVSGTNIANYNVTLNGAPFARVRTYFSGPLSGLVEMGDAIDGVPVALGDVLEISVDNFRPDAGDFETRLQVMET